MSTSSVFALAETSGCPARPTYVQLQELIVSPESLDCLAHHSASRFGVLPLAIWNEQPQSVLFIACSSAMNETQRERVAQHIDVRYKLHFLHCAEELLHPCIERSYSSTCSLSEMLGNVSASNELQPDANWQDQFPVQLVDALLREAVRRGASDLHISPEQYSVVVRLRVDGVLFSLAKLPLKLLSSLLVRIKIISALDIAETRLPQDGQFQRMVDGHNIDFRVSTFPTVTGENTVVRLINTRNRLNSLQDLNLPPEILRQLSLLVEKPDGLLVVCGPTGSGKSTTLFSLLEQLDHEALSVMTLEDPVERHIKGIRQTSIDASRHWGYAQGVRALLRQDPDVLLIGEIRDADSCAMALRAVSTGHQVLTTVHAYDAHGALHRLQELQAGNGALALGISAIVAQRLLRCLCLHCKGDDSACSRCYGTGYQGRQVVMEVLAIDLNLRAKLLDGCSVSELLEISRSSGFIDMRSMAMDLVAKGVTDVSEVNRVLGATT